MENENQRQRDFDGKELGFRIGLDYRARGKGFSGVAGCY